MPKRKRIIDDRMFSGSDELERFYQSQPGLNLDRYKEKKRSDAPQKKK